MESAYAVILNWNQPQATIDCARSLLADGLAIERILIVDNGSSDGSAARIEASLGSGTRLLCSDLNLGFAGGMNLGVRTALDESATWVILLNNDTIIQPGLLDHFRHAIALYPEFRLWGPLILYQNPPDTVWAVGDRSLAGTLLTRHLYRNGRVPQALPALVEVDYLTGCALLVHSDVFRAIGLLDASYFMYVEDADFCLRARRAGLRLACWTPARITHQVSLSSGAESPLARLWRVAYQARFYRRNAGWLHSALLFLASTLRTGLTSARDALHGRRALASAGLRGWRAGWFSPVQAALDVAQTSPAPHRSTMLQEAQWKK